MKKSFSLLMLLTLLASCASKPTLYPNKTYEEKGKELAQKDVDECMDKAKTYLESSEAKKIMKSTGFGAMVGGAMGAVAGAFYGDVGGGAARGAAIGGTGGAVSGALSPDEIKQRYVNRCLAEKGYEVIGWN